MITVSQLPTSPPPGIILMCPLRHGEWSACRGDYFMQGLYSKSELRCQECDSELVIVMKQTIYNFEEGTRWLEK